MNNKFYSKDERKILDLLNDKLGTKYRHKPYDFKNKEDLKELMIMLVGKYMNFQRYNAIAEDLYSELDESIELYEPLTWIAMTSDDNTGDDILLETATALGMVEDNLSDICEQTEDELIELLKIIMNGPDEVQKYIWNGIYHFDETALEDLFVAVIEAEYIYSIETSFEKFCSLMATIKNEIIEIKPTKNNEPIMLRLELINTYCDKEDQRMLMKYADTTEKGTIIRDILIPSDMRLHNLHYAIQRLFGWQNSHLRAFYLDDKDYQRLTNNQVRQWVDLAGILFRGDSDDEDDRFWDDDYNDENLKIWLKKRYTGPYIFGGYTEEYDVIRRSLDNMILKLPEVEVHESFDAYYERTKGSKKEEKEPIRILRKAPLLDLTMDELNDTVIFESNLKGLLERNEVGQILACKKEQLATFDELTNSSTREPVGPVTHKLIYNYDFGDNWIVEITKVDIYNQLHRNEYIKDDYMDQAINTVKEKYKPVCTFKKGNFVMDDVGGMGGYLDFLQIIYKSDDKEEKSEYRMWAKSLGWSNRKIEAKNML